MQGRDRRRLTSQSAWTTGDCPDPEQFDYWADTVGDAFVPVSVTRCEAGPFRSSLKAHAVGALGVSRISSEAQSVARTPAHIERRRGDVFFLNLPLTPGASLSQDGRTAHLSRGDFVLLDSSCPFEQHFERGFQQITVTLPHDCLAPLLAQPRQATALTVPGSCGVGAVASAALCALENTSAPLDRHAARAMADQLVGLVALALGGVQRAPASASRAALLQAALDEVERSLGDPDLSPGRVAERIGISTRYLHRLFADRGPSFGASLLARRLERCHRDLSNPARSHWTITEVACTHGFRDPSYFARAFRSRYGLSPRQYRSSL